MRRSRRVIGAAGTVVLVAGAVAGIDAWQAIEPRIALGTAFATTAGRQDLTTTVSVRTSPRDVQTLIDVLQEDSPQEPVPAPAARVLATLLPRTRFISRVHSTRGPLDEETDRSRVDEASTLSVDGAAIDVVRVGDEACLRVDVDGIGRRTGLFVGAQVRSMTDHLPSRLAWLDDVAAGRWIGLPRSVLERLFAHAVGSAADDPARTTRVRERIRSSLARNATFERSGAGDGGDEITVKVAVKPFVADLETMTDGEKPGAGPRPGVDSGDLRDDAVLTLTTVVEDGRVTHVEVSLGQVVGWFDRAKVGADVRRQLERLTSAGLDATLVVDVSTQGAGITEPVGVRRLTRAEADRLESLLEPAVRGRVPAPAP